MFGVDMILYTGVGFLVGVFTPGVCRTIKSWFSKETQAALTSLKTRLDTLETTVATSAIKKISLP
jgi:hypothetical protein